MRRRPDAAGSAKSRSSACKLCTTWAPEIAERTRPFVLELWEAKGAQLEAQQSAGDTGAATRRLRQAAKHVHATADRFLQQHRAVLEAAGLALDVCLEPADVLLDRFISYPSADIPTEVPGELLARFPEAVARVLPASAPRASVKFSCFGAVR